MNVNLIKYMMQLKTEVNRALDVVQVGGKVPFALTQAYCQLMELASEEDCAEIPPLDVGPASACSHAGLDCGCTELVFNSEAELIAWFANVAGARATPDTPDNSFTQGVSKTSQP